MAELLAEMPGMPRAWSIYFEGDRQRFVEHLRRAVVAGEDPAEVVLLDLDPPAQKTYPDFAATKQLIGVDAVCPTQLVKDGRRLYRDVGGKLASALGAPRTSEVALVGADGRIAYQGRIDDRVTPLVRRPRPTTHELGDAVDALLAGRDVAVAKAREVLARAEGRPGHIFNLGHGIHPDTNHEVVAAVVEAVQAWDVQAARSRGATAGATA